MLKLVKAFATKSAKEGTKDKALLLTPKTGTYPLGFVAGSISTGVKKPKDGPRKDLSLVLSSRACTVSAVFTKNSFAAAPVQVSKTILQQNGPIHALLINSGCANACTGPVGLANAQTMSTLLDGHFKTTQSTLVMSTGVIGQQLQMDKITKGVEALLPTLSDTHESWLAAAEGIMTTDTFPKLKSFNYPEYRISGWSKGAGMIHPNMATMLSAIFSDVSITKECLDAAVKHAADRSFNSISIDGDTSTNDTFAVFANGAAGGSTISSLESEAFIHFRERLTLCATELAKLIVRDGEGATKFVDVHVKSARTFEEAKQVALTIATSPLVKTAIYGCDANWGRIICATGYSGVSLVPEKVNLFLSSSSSSKSNASQLKTPLPSLHLFKNGEPFEINEEVAALILSEDDIVITVDLRLGDAEAHMYTCDFSHEYISINADYRS